MVFIPEIIPFSQVQTSPRQGAVTALRNKDNQEEESGKNAEEARDLEKR